MSEEALAWVESLGVTLTGVDLDALLADEMALSAVVARVVVASAALKILDAVSTAIADGVIPPEFGRGGARDMITTGLSKYDPRIAFQASLRSAYGAGRYERARRTGMPLLVYRSMRDSRVRDTHRVLNGVALPREDAFWDTHYPPNGWRCRCKAYAITEEDLKGLEDAGVPVTREAPKETMVPYTNRYTLETKMLPASIEPGWDIHPAKNKEGLAKLLNEKMAALKAAA